MSTPLPVLVLRPVLKPLIASGNTFGQVTALIRQNLLFALGKEPSGDRRPTWLTNTLLVGVLLIVFVLALLELFDLRTIARLDVAVVGVAGAVWVFPVR